MTWSDSPQSSLFPSSFSDDPIAPNEPDPDPDPTIHELPCCPRCRAGLCPYHRAVDFYGCCHLPTQPEIPRQPTRIPEKMLFTPTRTPYVKKP